MMTAGFGWNLEDDTVLERGVDLQALAGGQCEEILVIHNWVDSGVRSARYQRDNVRCPATATKPRSPFGTSHESAGISQFP